MDDGSRPEVIPGERIAFIAFHRGGEAPPSKQSVPGRLLKIHAAGGRTIDVEVQPAALSNPVGFFARATSATEKFNEYFFYAHGVSAKEDAALLGELLLRSGALNPEKLANGLAAQSDSRSVRIGSILVEEHNVSPEIVQQAVELQDRRRLRLGELLIESGWISDEQLKLALGEQKRRKGKRLGEVLVELGVLSEEVLAATLANKFLLPFVDLDTYEIDPQAAYEVPKDLIVKHMVLPVRSDAGTLTLAIGDPLAVQAIEDVRFHVRKRINELMVIPTQLKRHVFEHVACVEAETLEQGLEDLLREVEVQGEQDAKAAVEQQDVTESDSTVIRLVNRIILDAYRQGASDIHIEPAGSEEKTGIRFRVDGQCLKYQELPPSLRQPVLARIKIMAHLDISERRKPQDGKIRLQTKGGRIELRVATLPTVNDNEDAVLRILASSKPIPPEQMRFSGENLAALKKLRVKPYGLILVVGPTGSGKTTTLHSVLGSINDVEKKIWTAEDPVEITQAGLRQVQMQPKIGLTFPNALRAFLRADPDVIMVGEMRDLETASVAVEASLTGHLVFSTLHTNSAPETITRLVDMGLDPFSFADALLGILAQRLARSLCPRCRTEVAPTKADWTEMGDLYGPDAFRKKFGARAPKGSVLYQPQGCEACGNTGYKGRFGVHELLVVGDELRQAIGSKEPVEQLRAIAVQSGMTTLLQDGIAKVLAGVTDLKQILAVCSR